MPDRATIAVETTADPGAETLLVDLPQPGMANLTVADYLLRHREPPEIGPVDTEDHPAATPVADGAPRRDTQLFDLPDSPMVVLLGELTVPVPAGRRLPTAVSEWRASTVLGEVLLRQGIPYLHAETQHGVCSVVSESFRPAGLDVSR